MIRFENVLLYVNFWEVGRGLYDLGDAKSVSSNFKGVNTPVLVFQILSK